VGETKLSVEDRNVLESKDWLNDKHIHAAQQLLKKQHPQVAGLQNTILQCTSTFDVQGRNEFVQCLNLGGNHWITISTLKCPPAVVCVYDSLHYQLSPLVKKTVADLLQTEKEHIIIQSTQVQEGGSDCGLFAIATATTLCHGESPVDLEYDQSSMRSHLLK